LDIIIETNFLKYLGQYYSERHILARERMLTTQVPLARISLRYYQIIWLELRVEILE